MRKLLTVKCCANCSEVREKKNDGFYCKAVGFITNYDDELRDKTCRGHKWRKGTK